MKNNLSGPEFLAALEKRLRLLPDEERREALAYYAEFLEEGCPEELDSVEETARQILDQCAVTALEKVEKKEKKGGIKALWIVLLAVFAAPVALPLAIALGALILMTVVVAAAIVFAVGITGVALALGGLWTAVLSFTVIAVSPVNMLMALGLGLGLVGIGLLILIGMFYICRGTVWMVSKLLGGFLKRGGKNA